jgi:c-di-GMP-binding flagellar brake protein YcgR
MKTLDDGQGQKRKYARMPIVVLCDISKPDTGEILSRGCVINYSKGGLAVVTTAKIPFLSPVNVNVDGLEQKGFLSTKVVNDRMILDGLYAYGLEFEDMNALERVQIVKKFRRLFRMLVATEVVSS